jgi:succinate dehydrogenase/fumarate reductase flavoprotein subunit
MDHAYLSEQVKALQRELAEIAEHNRQYFATKSHSPRDRAKHQELRERVYQIRTELYALMEQAAA